MKNIKDDVNQNKIANAIIIFATIGILASIFGYYMQGQVYSSFYGAIVGMIIGILQKRKLRKKKESKSV